MLDRLTGACTAGSCMSGGAPPLACLACTTGTIPRPAATIAPNPSDTFTNFTYDSVGNRLTQVTYLGTTTSSYDATDRLTASTGPGVTTYTYDLNGNEISAGSTTYSYDLADRLTSATLGVTTQTYAYAGGGVRLSAATGTGAALGRLQGERCGCGPSVRSQARWLLRCQPHKRTG